LEGPAAPNLWGRSEPNVNSHLPGYMVSWCRRSHSMYLPLW